MTLAQVFYSEFCEIFKNTFFTEHLWWLLLTTQGFFLEDASGSFHFNEKENLAVELRDFLTSSGILTQNYLFYSDMSTLHLVFTLLTLWKTN